MRKILAVGRVLSDGLTEMRVIASVDVGTLTVSILQDGNGFCVDVQDDLFPGQIRCEKGFEQARRVFNGVVGAEAKLQDVVIGGSGESIELDEIPF